MKSNSNNTNESVQERKEWFTQEHQHLTAPCPHHGDMEGIPFSSEETLPFASGNDVRW